MSWRCVVFCCDNCGSVEFIDKSILESMSPDERAVRLTCARNLGIGTIVCGETLTELGLTLVELK